MTTRRPAKNCSTAILCFIRLNLAYYATGDATTAAVELYNDLSVADSIPAGRAGRVAGERHVTFKRPVCVKNYVHAPRLARPVKLPRDWDRTPRHGVLNY